MVRVGNEPWTQTQLDVYGEVLASAHLLRDQLGDMDDVTREFLTSVADLAADRWSDPDSGIWEARDEERRHPSSKVMCWVALDRAIDSPRFSAPTMPAARGGPGSASASGRRCWARGGTRASTRTGGLGSDHLDARVLLMPLVRFLPAADPRMRRTIQVLEREPTQSGLPRRWTGATDGAFVTCSSWLAAASPAPARSTTPVGWSKTTCRHANDLGLFSEGIDPGSGELLGNFPRGLSDIGLIDAA